MVSQIKRKHNFLKKIFKSKGKSRQFLIREATPEQIKSIRESVLNVANQNVPIKPKQFKKLKRYKKILKKLAFSNPSIRTCKKILVQRGGFLSVLIPPVLSYLATTFANA